MLKIRIILYSRHDDISKGCDCQPLGDEIHQFEFISSGVGGTGHCGKIITPCDCADGSLFWLAVRISLDTQTLAGQIWYRYERS